MESCKIMAAGLAAYLGEGYEIVLHSLEDLEHSVIAIFNGQHTGRRIGSPVTDLALNMLSQIEKNGLQDSITYFNRNKHGEPLKSTTIVIRGQNNRVIGLLCMNLYLNTSMFSMMKSWGSSDMYQTMPPIETLAEDASNLIEVSLQDAQERVNANLTIPVSNRNKEIIALMHERGIFKLKDAVPRVAELLHISKNTVYLHVRNIK